MVILFANNMLHYQQDFDKVNNVHLSLTITRTLTTLIRFMIVFDTTTVVIQ